MYNLQGGQIGIISSSILESPSIEAIYNDAIICKSRAKSSNRQTRRVAYNSNYIT